LGIALAVAGIALALAFAVVGHVLTEHQRRRVVWPPMVIAGLALGAMVFLLFQPIWVSDAQLGPRECGRVVARRQDPAVPPANDLVRLNGAFITAQCDSELDRLQRVAIAAAFLLVGCVVLTGYQVWNELRHNDAPPSAAAG